MFYIITKNWLQWKPGFETGRKSVLRWPGITVQAMLDGGRKIK
jgi:hypothetical protein